jgi:citrate lyase beta subunit
MKQNLSTRRMRSQPDLAQLKRQAKELLAAFRAADAAAVNEITALYDDPDEATLRCTMRSW